MENVISSGFQFKGFYIEETHFKIRGNIFEDLQLNIQPEGVHIKSDHKFHLKLIVQINDKENSFECEVICRGEFAFNSDGDIIPEFFYLNAPAIMFPYVRSYISTLTNLSTAGFPVTIPTLRLDFKEQLKDKIKVI